MTEPLASPSPDEALVKGPALWPGWFSDQQIAYEHAQHLANALGASVNAGQLARGWLDANATPPAKQPRKRKRHRVAVPGAHAVVIPQQVQPASQRRQPKPPSPRQYLIGAGVTGAILGVLMAVLGALWTAAWALGVSSATGLLGTGTVDTDAAALAALLADGDERIQWILETRLSRLERLLLAALLHHTDPDDLALQILAILSSLTSALLVTQTEVTWASGRGAYAVYVAAGVKWCRWQTRNDARVCGACLANQAASPVPLGQKYPSGDLRPLAHPRCVIGSTRIIAPQTATVSLGEPYGNSLDPASRNVGARRYPGGATAATLAKTKRDFGRENIGAVTDREYVGDVVTVRTALGYELTATPNHPIATRQGWVPIAKLAMGDHVLSSTGPEWRTSAIDPDVDDVPPRIEHVAESFPVEFASMPTAAEDFHGDGAGSDVHVVRADGLLVDNGQRGVPEVGGKDEFGRGDVPVPGTLLLDAGSAGQQELWGLGLTADRIVGGGSESGPLLGTCVGHPNEHGLTAASGLDSRFDETVANDGAADSEDFCERLLALAPAIALDEIVHVDRHVVATHVYNLDTVEGWYIGNGIVTHNCRCALLPAAAPAAKENGAA